MNPLKSALLCVLSGHFCCTAAQAQEQSPTVCHESAQYVIVEGATGEVGTHFLVKYKSAQNSQPPCDYRIQPGDFEIRNADAEYFLALQEPLLILDSGTGPEPRGLIIWDLDQRTKVHTGTYSDATVSEGFMEFWLESGAATDENCPEAKEWREGGLGAAIETQVRLDFSDFVVKPSSQTRCRARQ